MFYEHGFSLLGFFSLAVFAREHVREYFPLWVKFGQDFCHVSSRGCAEDAQLEVFGCELEELVESLALKDEAMFELIASFRNAYRKIRDWLLGSRARRKTGERYCFNERIVQVKKQGFSRRLMCFWR